MWESIRYVNTARTWGNSIQSMPTWGRFIVTIAAIPGILLMVLSIIALLVSILALLLLTVPAYRLVRLAQGALAPREPAEVIVTDPDGSTWMPPQVSAKSRVVEARVID